MKLAFYEVFGDPERNGQITVTREGTAQMVIPADSFINEMTAGPLECKINDHLYRLVAKEGVAAIFEGVVLPNTRHQRRIRFTPIQSIEGHQANGRIILRSGRLKRGEAIYDIRRMHQNTDATSRSMVCFTPGTRILTAFGELPIEDLRQGDLVHTADNGLQPLTWVGSREITRARLHVAPQLRPVKISKDAFGPGQPMADMWVSPAHRFLLKSKKLNDIYGESEILAPASGLVNGTTITTDITIKDTRYVHLLFEEHQVVFAENVPTESFLPCPSTLMSLASEARQQVFDVMPELRQHPLIYGQPARLALRSEELQQLRAA